MIYGFWNDDQRNSLYNHKIGKLIYFLIPKEYFLYSTQFSATKSPEIRPGLNIHTFVRVLTTLGYNYSSNSNKLYE